MLLPDAGDGAQAAGDGPPPEMFGTETMAELYARQGRLDDAIAVYRRLLAAGPAADRRGRWLIRLEALDRARVGATAGAALETELPRPVERPKTGAPPLPSSARPAGSTESAESAEAPLVHRLPLVVHEPVRAGQIVYAARNDLIILAPVHPGAEVAADGNIHVYASLRGRALAGADGCAEARIYCLDLQPELVAIRDAYLLYDDVPPHLHGCPVQVLLVDGRCVILPL